MKPWESPWNFHARTLLKEKSVKVIKDGVPGTLDAALYVCVPSRKDVGPWFEVEYSCKLLKEPVLRRFISKGNAVKCFREVVS